MIDQSKLTAPSRQAVMHSPQPMQVPSSMWPVAPVVIDSVGHHSAQIPQPRHFSTSMRGCCPWCWRSLAILDPQPMPRFFSTPANPVPRWPVACVRTSMLRAWRIAEAIETFS